jgi:hypothetical protein
MKRPFETVLELFRNNLSRGIEIDKRNQDFLHQFTIWLLGFSMGALYLIASNFLNVKSIFSYWTVKSIIIILTTSVIAGISHRIFLYLFQVLYNSNVFYAEGAFSQEVIMEPNPIDVSNEMNVETLINLLKNDFDEDESQVLKLYSEANEDDKVFLIKLLQKKYTDIGEWAKRDYEIAFNHVNTVMKKAFGLTDKEIKKLSKLSSGKIRFYRYAQAISLYVSCGCFILALIVLAIAY